MADAAPLVLDSVTHLPVLARGRVAICASHGGVYAAWYAARTGLAAMILHDAGIGREESGVGGLAWLDARGVPAACVGHDSARIGDGADMLARGVLSRINSAAALLGLEPGLQCTEALRLLLAARLPPGELQDEMGEARHVIGPMVVALDSNGLVGPQDARHIIVTGSHGGLLGGRAETAVKAAVRAAIYNDAGIGIDRAGLSRLPALDARGIAGATVSCFSARIGDAMSTWNDGWVSAVNATASAQGGCVGQSARDFVAALLEHA